MRCKSAFLIPAFIHSNDRLKMSQRRRMCSVWWYAECVSPLPSVQLLGFDSSLNERTFSPLWRIHRLLTYTHTHTHSRLRSARRWMRHSACSCSLWRQSLSLKFILSDCVLCVLSFQKCCAPHWLKTPWNQTLSFMANRVFWGHRYSGSISEKCPVRVLCVPMTY